MNCRPAFLGYSVGRWEGDVFVVDTAGFNDKTPLDGMGHHTKPFTIKVPHTFLADADIFEIFCESEKDRVHIQNVK